jgi:predicted nuclease with TOPRIM domain
MIYGDNDHGDMPVPQYALERELKDARREIKDLRTRLNEIKMGYEGCCHACEPVGAENCRLRELLNHTPEDILMRNQQLAIENEKMKRQLEDWKECFTNLAKERDLLWDDLERATKERQKQMMALDTLARLDEELGLLDSNTQTGILRRTDSPETGNLERTDDNGQS